MDHSAIRRGVIMATTLARYPNGPMDRYELRHIMWTWPILMRQATDPQVLSFAYQMWEKHFNPNCSQSSLLPLRLRQQLPTTVSVEKTVHNSTLKPVEKALFSSRKLRHQSHLTYSSSSSNSSKQKLRRRKARIDAFIRTSKVRELPMTRAITINWERLCGCPDQYEIKQPQLFRRLRLLANRLGFETAYIWVIDVGVNVGVHAHVALYWPSRYLSDLHQVFQALDSTWGRPPNNIHDEAIILERDGDFGWGEYMAEQSNKHPKDIPGRLLGCSTNLFDERR